MKANELRIGNILQVGGYQWAVNSIIQNAPGFDDFELYFIENDQYDHRYNAKPITLTEDWLFRFKFRCFPTHFAKKLKSKRSFTISWCGDKWLLCDTDITVFIQYVHQLQNLYFALTGKELTVKE